MPKIVWMTALAAFLEIGKPKMRLIISWLAASTLALSEEGTPQGANGIRNVEMSGATLAGQANCFQCRAELAPKRAEQGVEKERLGQRVKSKRYSGDKPIHSLG